VFELILKQVPFPDNETAVMEFDIVWSGKYLPHYVVSRSTSQQTLQSPSRETPVYSELPVFVSAPELDCRRYTPVREVACSARMRTLPWVF
jgi:hypothetical protein